VDSHSQAIAKLEVQMGQMANTLNRMEEGKLPSQPVVNSKGHYMVEASTSNHQQVLAITTLRSGRRFENHVQEKEDEQTETRQNLQKEKGKHVSLLPLLRYYMSLGSHF
jgi:AICAR transformylase/IMP cyclohydrolase PurH